MGITKKVTYVNEEGFEFRFEPIDDTLKIKAIKDGYEARYLIQDDNNFNPFEDNEGLGDFFHWDNGRAELVEYCEALGYDIDTHEKTGEENPDAVKIDKYEHSGVTYSLSGEGRQCRWDTSHVWAVWLPNACLLVELKKYKGQARRKKCIEFARQAVETFNQWANGDVYCIVKETYNKDKEPIDYDTCGGYYGYEYAEKALATDI